MISLINILSINNLRIMPGHDSRTRETIVKVSPTPISPLERAELVVQAGPTFCARSTSQKSTSKAFDNKAGGFSLSSGAILHMFGAR